MNRNGLDKTKRNKLVFVLVAALVAINASQGIVLCVDPDGRMSIRPAGHHYCMSEAHTHESADPSVYEDVHSETDHEHCEVCVDIPVSAEDRLISKAAQTLMASSVGRGSISPPADDLSAMGSPCRPFPTCDIPLRTVILQV